MENDKSLDQGPQCLTRKASLIKAASENQLLTDISQLQVGDNTPIKAVLYQNVNGVFSKWLL